VGHVYWLWKKMEWFGLNRTVLAALRKAKTPARMLALHGKEHNVAYLCL
jgi:hypothetical protein